jgi:hypothetical protein
LFQETGHRIDVAGAARKRTVRARPTLFRKEACEIKKLVGNTTGNTGGSVGHENEPAQKNGQPDDLKGRFLSG